MGSCVSVQGCIGDRQGKKVSDKCHTQHGKPPTTTRGKVTHQPSIEEAIDRNEKMKESLENEIEELQQQLNGSRYGNSNTIKSVLGRVCNKCWSYNDIHAKHPCTCTTNMMSFSLNPAVTVLLYIDRYIQKCNRPGFGQCDRRD